MNTSPQALCELPWDDLMFSDASIDNFAWCSYIVNLNYFVGLSMFSSISVPFFLHTVGPRQYPLHLSEYVRILTQRGGWDGVRALFGSVRPAIHPRWCVVQGQNGAGSQHLGPLLVPASFLHLQGDMVASDVSCRLFCFELRKATEEVGCMRRMSLSPLPCLRLMYHSQLLQPIIYRRNLL